jgi:hypothetical protein
MDIHRPIASVLVKSLRHRIGERAICTDGETSEDGRTISNLLSQAINEHVVADAPPDHDEVMATIPRAPGWVCALVGASAVIGLWTLIFLAARALLH